MKDYSSSGLPTYLAFGTPDLCWFSSFLGFTCLIQPIAALNFTVKHLDDYQPFLSSLLNQRQVIFAIIGGLFWLLIMAGFLLPEES
jgi:hypothetical protein